jgi:hypothetical protein
MMKVILDRQGFSKMINWPEERVGRDIYVPIEAEIYSGFAPLTASPTEVSIKRWEFGFKERLSEEVALYTFLGEVN